MAKISEQKKVSEQSQVEMWFLPAVWSVTRWVGTPTPHPSCPGSAPSYQISPLSLLMSSNHIETISSLIIESPQYHLILGYPWLCKHNPQMDWVTGKVLGWSQACQHLVCHLSVSSKSDDSSSEFPDMSMVPEVYVDLKEVFNKA